MTDIAGPIKFNSAYADYKQIIVDTDHNTNMISDDNITNGFVQKKYINVKPSANNTTTDTSFFYFVDGNYDQSTLQRIYSAFDAYKHDSSDEKYKNLNSVLNDFLKASANVYDRNGIQKGDPGYDPYIYDNVNKTTVENTYYRLVSGIEKYETLNDKKEIAVDTFGNIIYDYRFTYKEGEDSPGLEDIIEKTEGKQIGNNCYLIPTTQKSGKEGIGYTESLAYKGLALPYLALAVTFEKSLVQQDILLDEIAQVDAINNRITLNNNMLNAMNIVAQKYYTLSVSDPTKVGATGPTGDPQHYEVTLSASDLGFSNGVTVKSLNAYLLTSTGDIAYQFGGSTCPYVKPSGTGDEQTLEFSFAYTDSDNKNAGTSGFDSSKCTNIDVTEQGAQTGLSNMQDAIRSYGDKCTTAAQMANTYMQQYMQSMNSTINLGTQMCKNIGDYYKSVTNNIR